MKVNCLNIKRATLNLTGLIEFIKENVNFIYLLSVLICGLIIGSSCAVRLIDNPGIVGILTAENISAFQLFIILFLCYLSVITVNFSMGLCCVGMPFISLIPLFSGVISGSIMSLALNNFASQGEFMPFIRIAVALILLEAVIIYSSDLSLKMSERVIKSMFFGIKNNGIIAAYLTRYLLILVVSAVLSSASALIIKI